MSDDAPAAAFSPRTLRSTGGATASFCPYGAHVLSWHPVGAAGNQLFLSTRSRYAPGSAIRGGIPLIFPQFNAMGPLPRHGFARTRPWSLMASEHAAEAALELNDDDSSRALWSHRYRARLSVQLEDASLTVTLSIRNTDADAFSFTAALHTYLAVDNLARARVRGLGGCRYRDATRSLAEALDIAPLLAIEDEIDRIYLQAPDILELADGERHLRIERSGFPELVIWNPGPVKGAALSDLEEDGYRRMICIEPAVIAEPVVLAAGASWEGRQRLSLGRAS